ncbi:hypothetical protein SKAU_G00021220 [Synaphobranchus kaupii]|uniref:Uncharacterized protein n=1 Tax=Synaphobranchus kaupii TaxID=118154 RepID=A0A9Q1JEL6_SYNKA|nr:hypothetical protein SKAU_G00021220 [Synaphobranchus kaupii]
MANGKRVILQNTRCNTAALKRWMRGQSLALNSISSKTFPRLEEPSISSWPRRPIPARQQNGKVSHTFLRSLTAVIEEMGKLFLEESQDLLVLDSKDVMDASVADTVRKVSLSTEQYKTFVEERLEQRTKPVTDTLPKNKMPIFSHLPV